MIAVALAYGMALRWLTVRRRRMKIEMLAARREESKRKQAADASLGEGVKVTAGPPNRGSTPTRSANKHRSY